MKTVGKPENGTIGGTDGEASKAKPRIVVTGFETNPENVYAGDTFTLTIHVKNTSSEQSVTNVLFDMQAAEEGSDKTNTYSAFLPTSGASSVYMDSIGTNATADIVIEMTAKADLAQGERENALARLHYAAEQGGTLYIAEEARRKLAELE